MKIQINPEFERLIPPLTDDEYKQLEANILAEGLREPLVVWGDTLLDGHNRYNICKNHGLAFVTVQVGDVESHEDAVRWMLQNQLGRRNLSPSAMSDLRGMLYRQARGTRGGDHRSNGKSFRLIDAANEVAASAGVTDRTVRNDAAYSEALDTLEKVAPDIRRKLHKRDGDIGKAIRKGDATRLAKKPVEVQKFVLDKIESGESKSASEAMREWARVEAASAAPEEPARDGDDVQIVRSDAIDMLRSLDDGSVSLLLTDPPYNVTDNDWDTFKGKSEYLEFMRSWMDAARPKMAEQFTAFVFCDATCTAEIAGLLRDTGYPVLRQAIWHRPNLAKKRSGSMTFMSSYEPFWHCGTRPLAFPQEWGDERFDVQKFTAPQSNHKADQSVHPTQKPLALMQRLVALGSHRGELVVDPFCGSGTTAVAAMYEGRRCVTSDLSEEYVRIARGRLERCRYAA